MRLLTAAQYHYYSSQKGIEPQYYYLYKVPLSMGIQADFFDFHTPYKKNPERMKKQFLSILKNGHYDCVFLATYRDEFDEETLFNARKICPVIAWNSDDEVRWDNYSSHQIKWYTYMVTNSFSVYKKNCKKYPGLLHAQWACTGFWNGLSTRKDIPFSFVGQVYGSRKREVQYLTLNAHLQSWGAGTEKTKWEISDTNPLVQAVRKGFSRVTSYMLPVSREDTVSFEEANSIWNRSKISFTPLESSSQKGMQIKSRVFDMGLSGTLMLAPYVPELDNYYQPQKEYIPYKSLEECMELSKFYLNHESLRRRIALQYAKRTQSEHLWKYRISHVLTSAHLLK